MFFANEVVPVYDGSYKEVWKAQAGEVASAACAEGAQEQERGGRQGRAEWRQEAGEHNYMYP